MNNKVIKALIVDDEALSADMLGYLIEKNVPAISQVKKTTSILEAIELIESYKPDLLFLDVQMPYMNGFELLEKLKKKKFRVIFTTAYNKYAIKAIRFSALDYLLKPIDTDELVQAVERYVIEQNEKPAPAEAFINLVDNLKAGDDKPYRLALYTHHGLKLVSPQDIIRCEANNNYTIFFFANNTSLTTSKTIKEYEEILTEYNFVRVHKSHLVNMAFVEEFTSKQQLLLSNKMIIDVSRRRKSELMEVLKKR